MHEVIKEGWNFNLRGVRVMNVERRPLSIGVLVLNYNTWDLALRALDAAIRLESDLISEYVLFDDGSQALPPTEIDHRIRVIRGGMNRGFASALKVAFGQMTSDVVVLFDSDAYPLTPFATRVRERFGDDVRLGQLGFVSQDTNGSPTESFMSEPTKWSLLLGQALYAHVPQKEPRPSNLCVITACMATRLEAYNEIDGFDENFDWLDVDLDYSMRLRKAGWKVAVDPYLKALHAGGGTVQLQRHRVLRYYKNRWYLLRKHGLITNVPAARVFILTRLLLERTILKLFGMFLYRTPEVRTEKILGRQNLIIYCRANYR
jgi:GT2 family glycosyltransferase